MAARIWNFAQARVTHARAVQRVFEEERALLLNMINMVNTVNIELRVSLFSGTLPSDIRFQA
jgi:hypothetical protein